MIKRKTTQKYVIVADGKLIGIDSMGFLMESDKKKEILEFDVILKDFKDKEIQISISESINDVEEINQLA